MRGPGAADIAEDPAVAAGRGPVPAGAVARRLSRPIMDRGFTELTSVLVGGATGRDQLDQTVYARVLSNSECIMCEAEAALRWGGMTWARPAPATAGGCSGAGRRFRPVARAQDSAPARPCAPSSAVVKRARERGTEEGRDGYGKECKHCKVLKGA